jgi:hypothetical protein
MHSPNDCCAHTLGRILSCLLSTTAEVWGVQQLSFDLCLPVSVSKSTMESAYLKSYMCSTWFQSHTASLASNSLPVMIVKSALICRTVR